MRRTLENQAAAQDAEYDADAIAFLELLWGDGICVVEWPERMEPMLPPHTIRLRLEHVEGNRRSIQKWEG